MASKSWLLLATAGVLGGALVILGGKWDGALGAPSQKAAEKKAPAAKKQASKKKVPAVPGRNWPLPEVKIDETQWPPDNSVSLLVRLGLTDTKPTSWDGKIRAEGCRIERLRPWRFAANMSIDNERNQWQCASWLGPEPRGRNFDVHLPDRPWPFVRPGVLVDLQVKDPKGAALAVTTAQGRFRIDLEQLLGQTQAASYLGGRASAALAVFARPVAAGSVAAAFGEGGRMWHDYPSVAISPVDEDDVWFCYQTYSEQAEADQIMVRRRWHGKWQEPVAISPEPGDYYRTALAFDGQGRLWAVTAAQIDGNWDLYGRQYVDGRWQAPQQLTWDDQPDMHHRLVRTADGALWLVWQGFRDGQSDILARRWDGQRWHAEVRVSTSAANDWEPSAAALPGGGLVVAWDSYEHGQYDVFCRTVRSEGPAGPVIRVTGAAQLEARASVACDQRGRAWIAFDTSGPHWGKDTGFWPEIKRRPQGTRLYQGRGIGLRLVDLKTGQVLLPPTPQVRFPLDHTLAEQIEYPHLLTDRQGRLWMFFRRKADIDVMKRGVGWRFHWEMYLTRLDPQHGRWTEPRLLSYSIGRLDMRPGWDVGRRGLWAAWACNHRLFVGLRPDVCNVFAGRIPLQQDSTGDVATVQGKPAKPFPPPVPDPVHANEKQDVARVRSYTIRCGQKEYHIYRGDMHRHTENSPDGGNEGSLLDAYRYALDAAAMDFLLVTDHNDGQREYDWWQREKSNDLFRVGQAFVGLYGYERSVGYPNGHRNVFFTRRGVRPLDIVERRIKGGEMTPNSGEVLYPYLRINGGICFSHTSATGMGTDWRDNDPRLEPLVEIYQGDRTNYESPDAPWAAKADDPATQEGGYRPLGYVDRALAKGYRLGFQASSDHLSTHLSYSCILAEANTRRALQDAMRRRHAYGATDNIIMDVRAEGTDGPHIMGDVFTTRGAPTLKVTVIGTDRLHRVVVIKDNQIVYTAKPDGNRITFQFTDMKSQPGKESYYYVRAVQRNERMAWASPMWITRLADDRP